MRPRGRRMRTSTHSRANSVSCLVRYAAHSQRADVAVEVVDAYHRRGIGRALMQAVTESAALAEGERQNVGVVVDAVQAVLEISSTEIEPPPNFGAKIRGDFIEGIGKVSTNVSGSA